MRALMLFLCMTGAALAQAPSAPVQKFPTPPPPVTAENSVIGPDYANAPESVANPAVPQGEIREFILYSADSKIYPGIVRIADMKRDVYGNYVVPPGGISAPGPYQRHVAQTVLTVERAARSRDDLDNPHTPVPWRLY